MVAANRVEPVVGLANPAGPVVAANRVEPVVGLVNPAGPVVAANRVEPVVGLVNPAGPVVEVVSSTKERLRPRLKRRLRRWSKN